MMAHVIQHLSPACPGLPTRLCVFPALPLCLSSFLTPMSGSTEEFSVTGPSDPIVAVLGGDTVLPCRVFPPISAEDMELRWFRSKFSEAVFSYQNRVERNEEQMARYVGRTSLDPGGPPGLYILPPAGVGSAPQVRITGPEEDGVRVVCTSSGWFPKPQVRWRDLSGEKSLAFSEAHTPDAEGLFGVEAALVVRDSSAGNVTCSVLNTVLGQEKAMAIFIPEPFFPQASPWKLAFSVSLSVLMVLLLGAGCYTKREHSMKLLAMRAKESLRPLKERDRWAKEEALKEAGKAGQWPGLESTAAVLRWMTDRRACLSPGLRGNPGPGPVAGETQGGWLEPGRPRWVWGWKLLQVTHREVVFCGLFLRSGSSCFFCTLFQMNSRQNSIGGRRSSRPATSSAGPVTLDPGSAHSDLVVSHENTTVAWKDTSVTLGDTCSVLGFESITSGCCYWEVEIRDRGRSEWALGVCRENVNRNGWHVESPDKGFWVVGQYEARYCALTLPQTKLSLRQAPRRVGVFLDHKEGDVSFYNMTDGSHIFSFPRASFFGTVFPYFMIRSGDVSLTVCSKEGWSEGNPVPHNSSFLEEPVSLPGEGFSSGSGANALPVAESPLLPCKPEAVSP
eukprot:bmy_03109T0